MDRQLVKDFWSCGDNDIIEFAMLRARLNRNEKEVVRLILDECMTQEQTAEHLDMSVRRVQDWWYTATDKLLGIPWLVAYAYQIRAKNKEGN